MFAQGRDDRRERRGGRGQVVEAVLRRPPLAVELGQHILELVERVRVAVLAGHVPEAPGEGLPDVLGLGPPSAALLDQLAHPFPEVVVGHLGAGHADDREPGRQQAPEGQVLDGGHELAAGEVA